MQKTIFVVIRLLPSILLLVSASQSIAALKPGDILVSDNESNHLVRVDPDAPLQMEFADRGDVALCSVFATSFAPQGLAVDPSMRAYVVNLAQLPFPAPSEVIRFNLDGSCDSVGSGINLVESEDVGIEATGMLIIPTFRCPSCGFGGFGAPPALIRLNPVTGAKSIVTSGGFLIDPEMIAIDPVDGSIMVADDGNPSVGFVPRVVRVDPSTGVQTMISFGGFFLNLSGIAIEAAGTLVVTDRGNIAAIGVASQTKVIRIDPSIPPTANQSRVDDPNTLPNFEGNRPEYDGIAVDRDGKLIVGVQVDGPIDISPGPNGGIFRMEPDTGAQALLTFGGPTLFPGFGVLEGLDGVAVVPEPAAGLLQLVALAVLATAARRVRLMSASSSGDYS